MKYLKFFEFNRKDIQRIKSEDISKDFTIAIEFELETNDLENHDITFDNFDYDDIDEFKKICKDLTVYNIDIKPSDIKINKSFINDIIDTIENYIYLVPYIENENEIFLKTIYPSRKFTKIYLGV